MTTSRDLHIGDMIVLERERKVEVRGVQEDGVYVKWYKPNGVGPYFAVLPHVPLSPVLYEPDSAGQHVSWWQVHPDVTGRYGVF